MALREVLFEELELELEAFPADKTVPTPELELFAVLAAG
jgi:hypothetical protein